MTDSKYNITAIRDLGVLSILLRDKGKQEGFLGLSIDLETTGVDPYRDTIVGVGLAFSVDTGVYIPLRHRYDQPSYTPEDALKVIQPYLEYGKWIAFNAQFEAGFLRKQAHYGDIIIENAIDAQIVAYVVAEYETPSLKNVCKVEFPDMKPLSYSEFMASKGLSAKKQTIAELPIDEAADYCVKDAIAAYRIVHKYWNTIKDNQIFKLETKVLPVVMWLRDNGILLDPEFFKTEEVKLKEELEVVRKIILAQISQQVGEPVEFSLDSSSQLSTVLYDRLHLPCDKVTEAGNKSTSKDVLNRLKWKFPIVKNIITYREIQKRLTTYFATYLGYAQADGRIHASYNQTGVITGRFSCSDPNLQNIPGKMSWDVEVNGKIQKIETNIRNGFIVPEDCWFVEFDYNQIEARIAAGVTKEPVLMQAFNSGIDYHTKTASLVFAKPIDQITKEERQMGKKLNFALAYGMGPGKLFFTLMVEMEITMARSKEFYRKYLEAYPTMFNAARQIADEAMQVGSVKTMFGRKVPIFNLRKANPYDPAQRGIIDEGRRLAYNARIQGTAGDVLKLAMVRLYKLIKSKYGLEKVKLILTTHDSLSFEVNKAIDLKAFISDVLETMETKIPNFPVLSAGIEIGTKWGNPKKMEAGESLDKFLDRVMGTRVDVKSNGNKVFVVELPEGQAQRTAGQIQELKAYLDARMGDNTLVIKIGNQEKVYPKKLNVGIEDRERILLMVGGKFYERFS